MASVVYKKNILLTLGYSAQFSHALSASELFRRLLNFKPTNFTLEFCCLSESCKNTGVAYKSDKSEKSKKSDKSDKYLLFASALAELLVQGNISRELKVGEYVYSLKNTTRCDFSEDAVQNKIGEIDNLIRFVSHIPWISALVLTGSVAAGTVRVKDDVDFMVITRPSRMWLVRPVLILFAWSKGKRRTWHSEEPNSWCFNLWLEETDLALAQKRRTVYTAYEVCQAKFVYLASARESVIASFLHGWTTTQSNCELAFLSKNIWVVERIPQYFVCNYAKAVSSYKTHKTQETSISISKKLLVLLDFLLEPVFLLLNLLAFLLQYLYMLRHMTTEEVKLRFAFFHPRNTKKQLYLGWKKQLQQLQKQNSL